MSSDDSDFDFNAGSGPWDDGKNREAAIPTYVKLDATRTGIIISSRLAMQTFGLRLKPEFIEQPDEFHIKGVNGDGQDTYKYLRKLLRNRFTETTGTPGIESMVGNLMSVLWMFESVKYSSKGTTVSYEERLEYLKQELPLLVTQEKKINAAIKEFNQYIQSRKWKQMIFPDLDLEFKFILPREIGIRKIKSHMVDLEQLSGAGSASDVNNIGSAGDANKCITEDRKRKADE